MHCAGAYQLTGEAGLVAASVTVGVRVAAAQVEAAHERGVQQGMQDAAHETGVAQVGQAPQPSWHAVPVTGSRCLL